MDLVDHISFEFEFVDISDLLCVKWIYMKIRRPGIMVLDWFSNLPSLQYISPPPCSCSEHLHYSLG